MNILEVLIKLRDDIKAWVTTNLNALDNKIEEKTIPVDSELSTTSINPVQNKVISEKISSLDDRVGDTPVATQILTAIASQPTFSGDYNDLTNAPNISEDESDNVVVADRDGNIVLKVDKEGVTTTNINATAIKLDGEDLGSRLDMLDANALSNIIDDGSDNLAITDDEGNVIAKVNASGFETTQVKADSVIVEDIDIGAKIKGLDSTLSSHVKDDDIHVTAEEKEAWNNRNDFSGSYKDLSDVPTDLATEGYVNTQIADLVGSSPEALNTLNELAAALGDDPNFATTVAEQIGLKANQTALDEHTTDGNIHITNEEREAWNSKSDFSGEYSDLKNAPDIVEDGSGEYVITDPDGNIAMKVGSQGVETTKIITQAIVLNDEVITEIDLTQYATDKELDDHTSNETVHITEDERKSWNAKADSDHDHEEYVVKEDGKGLSTEDFTTAEKEKLAKLSESSGNTVSITVDSELSTNSTNPVQNKVITETLNALIGETSVSEQISDATEKITETLDEHLSNKDAHITAEERQTWNDKSDFSGNYDDLQNKPPISADEIDNVVVADLHGNIVATIDSVGINAVGVFSNGVDLKKGLDNKVDKVDGMGLSTNDYNDLSNLPTIPNIYIVTFSSSSTITDANVAEIVSTAEAIQNDTGSFAVYMRVGTQLIPATCVISRNYTLFTAVNHNSSPAAKYDIRVDSNGTVTPSQGSFFADDIVNGNAYNAPTTAAVMTYVENFSTRNYIFTYDSSGASDTINREVYNQLVELYALYGKFNANILIYAEGMYLPATSSYNELDSAWYFAAEDPYARMYYVLACTDSAIIYDNRSSVINNVYVQNEEPEDASDGSIWVDLDDEGLPATTAKQTANVYVVDAATTDVTTVDFSAYTIGDVVLVTSS